VVLLGLFYTKLLLEASTFLSSPRARGAPVKFIFSLIAASSLARAAAIIALMPLTID